jgi:hypothetical protein
VFQDFEDIRQPNCATSCPAMQAARGSLRHNGQAGVIIDLPKFLRLA